MLVVEAGIDGRRGLGPSSASSLISSSLLEEIEGDAAVCKGKDAANDVSFSPSGVEISSKVS